MGHDAGFACRCVTEHYPGPAEFHLHHVVPLYAGGGENPENEVWLCLHGDVPVLMADGTEKAVSTIRTGDSILGGDLRPDLVTAVWARSGNRLIDVQGLVATPDHLVLTSIGWRPIEQALRHQMLGERVDAYVLGLVLADPEVFGPVVVGHRVDVVDNFARSQRPSQHSLHHEPGPAYRPSRAIGIPEDEDPVALIVGEALALALHRAGCRPQPFETTGIRAIERPRTLGMGAGPGDLSPTDHARGDDLALLSGPAQRPAAGARAGRISRRQPCWSPEGRRADGATQNDERHVPVAQTRWHPYRDGNVFAHGGPVYDIAVQRSRSFIAAGWVVHNCPTSHVNVHELIRAWERAGGEPSWEERRRFGPYIRDLARRGWEERSATE